MPTIVIPWSGDKHMFCQLLIININQCHWHRLKHFRQPTDPDHAVMGVRSSYLAQQNSCPTANNHYALIPLSIFFATGLSLAVYIHVNISGASDSSKQKKGKNYISNKVAAYKAKMTDTALCSDLTFLLFSGCWIWSPHVGLFSCNKGGLVFFQPNFSSGSGCYWPF